MGFFSRLFFKGKKQEEEDEFDEEPDENVIFHREGLHVHDKEDRRKYIQNCIDQITDSSRELNSLKGEYNIVTSYLTDMEEIEALPKDLQYDLRETAKHLLDVNGAREEYIHKENRMTDEQFQDMQQIEDEVENGLRELKDAEHYQKLVRSDLRRLDNENHAYLFRRTELETDTTNYKGMSIICFITMLVCLLLLLGLQMFLHLNVKFGYILTVCVAALAITGLFVKFNDATSELDRLDRSTNRLIQLQNTVKIRYVNNKHLLDYLCLKFHVKSAEELEMLWNRYASEKEERERYENITKDYNYYQQDLLKQLKLTRVKDPTIWLHQAAALIDSKEMIEVRHQLILRRQSLRSQMEYNRNIAEEAQHEIRDIAREYPQYADEITAMVATHADPD